VRSKTTQLFSFIDNSLLSEEFFNWVETHRKRVALIFKIHHGQDVEDKLSRLSFLDLLAFVDTVPQDRSIRLVHFNNKREEALDAYLIGAMIYQEFSHIYATDTKDAAQRISAYLKFDSIKSILDRVNGNKLLHDQTKQFLAAYTNSFIKNDKLKLTTTLRVVDAIAYNDINTTRLSDPFSITPWDIVLGTRLLASLKCGIINQDAFDSTLSKITVDAVKNYLSFDYLNASPEEYSEKLIPFVDWLSKGNIYYSFKATIFNEWVLEQCRIYYAFNRDMEKLDYFIKSTMNVLVDYYELSIKDSCALSEFLHKQSLLIEPATYTEAGYSKSDYFDPLKNLSPPLKKYFNDCSKSNTHCANHDDFWLTSAALRQIIKDSGIQIKTADIFQNFTNTDYAYEALQSLKPTDKLDYFINEPVSASAMNLYKVFAWLMETEISSAQKIKIQNRYCELLISKRGDKLTPAKTHSLAWQNRDLAVEHLKGKGLAHRLSAITLLNIKPEEISEFYSMMSNDTKRYLLTNDLSL
jgi:hypothetical protein